LEAAAGGVLVLVFSVGLLDYAYHHERQTIERLLASRTPSPLSSPSRGEEKYCGIF
jgi:hypothetical protein